MPEEGQLGHQNWIQKSRLQKLTKPWKEGEISPPSLQEERENQEEELSF